MQAKPAQTGHQIVEAFRIEALLVCVFNAQDELTTGMTSIKPIK
jgi:hypothetical protein